MSSLGKGVYASPNGSGPQNVTVADATVVGDTLVAIYTTQVVAGANPTWTPPGGWTIDFQPTISSGGYSAGGSNWLALAHIAPGAQPKNTVYTFTMGYTGTIIIMLFRCNEQILAGISTPTRAKSDLPSNSPDSLAVTFPLSAPGFDFYVVGGTSLATGGGPFTPAVPTGETGFCAVCTLDQVHDNENLGIYVLNPARNVAFTGTLSSGFVPNGSGWNAMAGIVQLGATNTPSTLAFPKCIPGSNSRGRLRGGGSGAPGGPGPGGGKVGGFTDDPFGGFTPGRWPPIYYKGGGLYVPPGESRGLDLSSTTLAKRGRPLCGSCF